MCLKTRQPEPISAGSGQLMTKKEMKEYVRNRCSLNRNMQNQIDTMVHKTKCPLDRVTRKENELLDLFNSAELSNFLKLQKVKVKI